MQGLKVARMAANRDRLTWSASPEPDLCYYRVYRGPTQLGSTVATAFEAAPGGGSEPYRIVAVDQEGNASE